MDKSEGSDRPPVVARRGEDILDDQIPDVGIYDASLTAEERKRVQRDAYISAMADAPVSAALREKTPPTPVLPLHPPCPCVITVAGGDPWFWLAHHRGRRR